MLLPGAMTKPRAIAGRVRRDLRRRLVKGNERSRWLARRGTARFRLPPTFLVIGAQKAGTSSLYWYLKEHPAILCASPKEVHYFDHAHHQGSGWYVAHFPLAPRAAVARKRVGVRPVVGEVTPEYLFNPLVPERVRAFDPAMKLIAILRDPVTRAYSQYHMQIRQRREPHTFEDALALEASALPAELQRVLSDPSASSREAHRLAYVARGRYAEQLERWLEFFPREQLFVLTSDELRADPADAMSGIAHFLDIPEYRSATYTMSSVKEYPPMDPATSEHLARIFESDNRRLELLLGRALDWTRPQAVTRESRPQ